MQLVARGEDDGWEEQIEEILVIEADVVLNGATGRDANDQADDHADEDGDDGLVDGLDLALLEEVAGEEGCDEQHYDDEERP